MRSEDGDMDLSAVDLRIGLDRRGLRRLADAADLGSRGAFPLSPASIPITGPAGSTGTLEVCAFDAAAAASGKPYDCCRAG